jgi:hypothetical protein
LGLIFPIIIILLSFGVHPTTLIIYLELTATSIYSYKARCKQGERRGSSWVRKPWRSQQKTRQLNWYLYRYCILKSRRTKKHGASKCLSLIISLLKLRAGRLRKRGFFSFWRMQCWIASIARCSVLPVVARHIGSAWRGEDCLDPRDPKETEGRAGQ